MKTREVFIRSTRATYFICTAVEYYPTLIKVEVNENVYHMLKKGGFVMNTAEAALFAKEHGFALSDSHRFSYGNAKWWEVWRRFDLFPT